MNQSPHSLILASAGTGKTYRLSNRFLALLLSGVEPERILATTFTRKAAGEILDRVLERLMLAAESEKGRADLAAALEAPELTREQCLELLCRTTRRLDAFQVRTIDSFFVHLSKLFALDLKLPPGWTITDERVDDRVQSEALQQVLADESKETLAVLIRELTKGNAGRGVHRALLNQVAKLRGIYLEASEDAWDSFAVGEDVSDGEFEGACAEVALADVPVGKTGKPNGNWVKARDSFVQHARSGNWETLVTGGIGAKLLAGQPYYNFEIPEEMASAMGPILLRTSHTILREAQARNLAAHGFLDTFEEAYQAKKREQGAYGFADLPHAFAPHTAKALPIDERELDLWFRLDGRIDHLLLDEFQDTSPVQWRILAPIAEQITAEGDGERSFFCVGDVKQSIYSFRQAEPRLLRDLHKLLPGLDADCVERMNKSYRSSQAILDTVNQAFGELASSPLFAGEEHTPHRKACEAFAADFDVHEAAKDLPGVANMVQVREGVDKEVALIERIVERVLDILSDAPGANVGILMRTRKPIPKIINQLGLRGIEASGEGGNVLTDARSVLVFLSLLQLTDFPDDSAAAFHLAESPFAQALGLKGKPSKAARRQLSRDLRASLAELGLAGLVSKYAQQVAHDEAWSAWDKARFAQLLDLAYIFERGTEPRPSAFVDHVRKCCVEVPGGARVRVMTIHASKGLEFDAVILPQLDSKFVSRPADVLVDRPRAEQLIQGATLSIKKALLPISVRFRELYDDQTARSMGDDLCVLYVAMTRAARRLDMIVAHPVEKKSAGQPTVADHLRQALAVEASEVGEDGLLWSHALGADWSEGLAAEQAPVPAAQPKALSFAGTQGTRNFSRRSASREEGGGKRTVTDAIKPQGAADQGTLVHGLLETLVWSEDFDAASALENKSSRQAKPEEVQQAHKVIQAALASPEIALALSKNGCGAPAGTELEVLNEAPFSLLREGELWSGAIDRLVLARSAGQVVWAQIIDFKSDSPGPEGLDGLVERYRPQLRCYAEIVAELYDLAPDALSVQLLFLRAGAVCSLS